MTEDELELESDLVREGQGPPQEAMPVRKSQALTIWFAVIAVVLALLFLETMGSPNNPGFNVAINLHMDTEGSQILIDGQIDPALQKAVHSSSTSQTNHSIWLNLKDGKHSFEVRKDGKTVLSRQFEVRGKIYLRFDSGNDS